MSGAPLNTDRGFRVPVSVDDVRARQDPAKGVDGNWVNGLAADQYILQALQVRRADRPLLQRTHEDLEK